MWCQPQLSDSNIILCGQQKLISDRCGAVSAFEMKLKLFRKTEIVNLCHFLPCDLFHKYASVSVPFPRVRAVEMDDSLAENFKTSCSTFVAMLQIHLSLKTRSPLKSVILQKKCRLNWVNCSMTQFCVLVSARKSQLPFMLLYQYPDSLSYVSWHEVCKVHLVARVHVNRLWQNKSKFRSRITDV